MSLSKHMKMFFIWWASYKMYLHSRNKKFVELPCSSNEIRQNIKRAYYQTRMWLESAYGDTRDILCVENFGFDSSFAPVWFLGMNRPSDVPLPCQCKSCSRRTCPCREKELSCSNFCKCLDHCKNPLWIALQFTYLSRSDCIIMVTF